MTELDNLYLAILRCGLAAIRNASNNGDIAYCKAESEHLHEMPSLIGEGNMVRHHYYATKQRAAYLEWIAKHGRDDVRAFVDMWYASAWKKMDALLGLHAPNSE
jgi:hypothetical protein